MLRRRDALRPPLRIDHDGDILRAVQQQVQHTVSRRIVRTFAEASRISKRT
jgi:hypothetical protein